MFDNVSSFLFLSVKCNKPIYRHMNSPPAPKSINSGRLRAFSDIYTSFEPSSDKEQSYVSVLENIALLLRKSKFSTVLANATKNRPVIGNFVRRTFSYEQNACDIQNQHKKLSRTAYVLVKNIFHHKTPVLPFRYFFS